MRSTARAPYYRRAERLLQRRSGGVARLSASGLTPVELPTEVGIFITRQHEVELPTQAARGRHFYP